MEYGGLEGPGSGPAWEGVEYGLRREKGRHREGF